MAQELSLPSQNAIEIDQKLRKYVSTLSWIFLDSEIVQSHHFATSLSPLEGEGEMINDSFGVV
jgi:hypothetical protein